MKLRFKENTPKRIRIQKKFFTIRININETDQKYLKQLLKYDEVAEYIEEYDDNDIMSDKELRAGAKKALMDLKMKVLRELYPEIKYNVSKDKFTENILNFVKKNEE